MLHDVILVGGALRRIYFVPPRCNLLYLRWLPLFVDLCSLCERSIEVWPCLDFGGFLAPLPYSVLKCFNLCVSEGSYGFIILNAFFSGLIFSIAPYELKICWSILRAVTCPTTVSWSIIGDRKTFCTAVIIWFSIPPSMAAQIWKSAWFCQNFFSKSLLLGGTHCWGVYSGLCGSTNTWPVRYRLYFVVI